MKNKLLTIFLIFCATCHFALAIEGDVKQTRAQKRAQKEKIKYSNYYIPQDTMLPEELKDDRLVIEGSVSKSLDLNLANCIELALKYNPNIKAAYANAAAIKTHKGQTISKYTPRIDLKGNFLRTKPDMSSFSGFKIDPFNRYTLGQIGVKQLVYDFGVAQNTYTIDKIDYETSLEQIESVVNDVICNVKSSYYALITAYAKREVMKNTVEQFEQTYFQARAFYEVGSKSKIDVTIASTNLADAKAQYIEAKNDVYLATATLNNAMGLPFLPEYLIEDKLPFEKVDVDMDALINIANENRPDLKATILQIKKTDEQVKLVKKSVLPAIEFQGSWSYGGRTSNDPVNWYDAGGYLTFPTINPVLVKYQIDEAKRLYESQQYKTKNDVNNIYYDIQTAYSNLLDKQERVPVSELSMKESKENYELSAGRYKVGEADAIELKDAQIQYQKAQLAYYNTLYEYNRQKTMLERAIGQTLFVKDRETADVKRQEGLQKTKNEVDENF